MDSFIPIVLLYGDHRSHRLDNFRTVPFRKRSHDRLQSGNQIVVTEAMFHLMFV